MTIRGTKDELDWIESTRLDFNKIIPMPEPISLDISDTCVKCGGATTGDMIRKCNRCNIQNNIGGRSFESLNAEEQRIAKEWEEKYGYWSWYTWCIENWGTKWNASEVEISRESPTVLNVYFATAWSAPVQIIKKLSSICREIFLHVDNEGDNSFECKISNNLIYDVEEVESNNNTMFLGGAPSRSDISR